MSFLKTQIQNSKRVQHFLVSNTVMGNIILLLLRGNNFTKTIEIISLLVRSPHLIKNGQTITTEHINEIFELCLAQAYVPAIFVSIYTFFLFSFYFISFIFYLILINVLL